MVVVINNDDHKKSEKENGGGGGGDAAGCIDQQEKDKKEEENGGNALKKMNLGKSFLGVCGFDNGPCGLAHINSTMKWIFYTPTGKDGYPRYDHSMENEGELVLLSNVCTALHSLRRSQLLGKY